MGIIKYWSSYYGQVLLNLIYEWITNDEKNSNCFQTVHFRNLRIYLGSQYCIPLGIFLELSYLLRLMTNVDFWSTSIVSSNLKRTIACTAIREGGEEEWDFAFKRYNETNVATEKAALLSAMSCSQQAWILGRSVWNAYKSGARNRSINSNQLEIKEWWRIPIKSWRAS